MFLNVVVGSPLMAPEQLLAADSNDWLENEKPQTLFTETRYLPAILKEAGIVSSSSEVRKNKPELNIVLKNPDFMKGKWGKKFLHIFVGR